MVLVEEGQSQIQGDFWLENHRFGGGSACPHPGMVGCLRIKEDDIKELSYSYSIYVFDCIALNGNVAERGFVKPIAHVLGFHWDSNFSPLGIKLGGKPKLLYAMATECKKFIFLQVFDQFILTWLLFFFSWLNLVIAGVGKKIDV